MLENYLNRESEKNGPKTFIYGYIAIEFGIPEKRVREVLFGVDCGHNGIIVSHGVNGEPADFVKRIEEARAKGESGEREGEKQEGDEEKEGEWLEREKF